MALQSSQLSAAITASQTQFAIANGNQTGLPAVGAVAQSIGVPMLIDSEFMFCIAQPTLNNVVVRGRGSDGTAPAAHDILANVYFSNIAGDFANPQAGTATTLDPAEDAPVSIGQDATLPLVGANTIYNINKNSACAITLLTPSLQDNGVTVLFTSNTAFAHTITVPTGLIQDASGVAHTTATFTANKGCSCAFLIENGFYNVDRTSLGVTFS